MRISKILAGASPKTAEKFWNIASTSGDSGEITLYGDVMSQKPRSWWTGEERPGLYITPEGCMEDLAAVKGKKEITIKINSCGGDLYTGIAIHNAIKALNAHKTVIVEGIAASAASVIACAGDELNVYPGSMIMIHEVSAFLYDQYDRNSLEKTLSSFEAANKAIAEIYHAKTGLDVEKLRDMMEAETWFVGREAIDEGFADNLLEGEAVEATLSADHKLLFVAGRKHNIEGFHNVPKTIHIQAQITKKPETTKKEEHTAMTKEELKNQYPDLVAQIVTDAENAGREAERLRIQEIESIANAIGDQELVNEAKFKKPCQANELALLALQKQAKIGTKILSNTALDHLDSGVEGVNPTPTNGIGKEVQTDEQTVDNIVAEYKKLKGETE